MVRASNWKVKATDKKEIVGYGAVSMGLIGKKNNNHNLRCGTRVRTGVRLFAYS